ncbi:hypothetical protein GCM10023189_11180 [Nibrella saemangeumensis]|uniref:Uncharacterized protein n=1 Tax=Nibrella saemangeumensis TaxID=1084526 RepID=A0ABP8MJD9_9BACT
MADKTTADNPAAGPLTLVCELLSEPTMIPPIIPDITPDNNGAPEASATPKQSGSATKNTTMLAGISFDNCKLVM